jgi:hypothetical protein
VLLGMLGALALALAVAAIADDGGSWLWVAVAAGAACACGIVVGSSARVLPAMVLAIVAAAALVLAVEGRDDGSPEPQRTFQEAAPR